MYFEEKETGNTPKIENFSKKHVERPITGPILVDVRGIAADKWPEMQNRAQKSHREQGVVVSRLGTILYTSKIFEGYGERNDYDNPHRKIPASFTPPLFPHGLISLHPGMENIVLVHVHPIPPELDHLITAPLSDTDIHTFVKHNYKGLVSLDRGGVHLLVRTRHSYNESDLLTKNIVDETITEVRAKNGTTLDVIKLVDHKLSQYGLGYFYTSNLVQNPKGYVEFFDPKNVQ